MNLVLTADRLIDGSGAAPLAAASLVVADGRIAGVFAGPVPEGAAPAGARRLDFPGCTILPGLIDAHVHLNLPGDGTTLEEAVRETDGVLVATGAYAAGRALAAGITTVRDLGGARRTVIDLKRALALGHGEGARIVACGQPITITGGHTWPFGGEADGPDALRRKVREMAKLGADFIKVMASGGGTLGTLSWRSSYGPEELRAITDEAHRLGRTATAHCLCAAATEAAIDAGFDGIEHAGFLVDRSGRQEFVPAVAEKLARAGIPVTATLAVGAFMLDALRADPAADPALRARWERMAAENLAQFSRLREAGVRFVAGTDAGWRFTRFDGLKVELALMHEGGMPALEAIEAATGRAAAVLGIGDETGMLRPGLAADVLVVQGDPLADLSRLGHPRLVLQGGRERVSYPA